MRQLRSGRVINTSNGGKYIYLASENNDVTITQVIPNTNSVILLKSDGSIVGIGYNDYGASLTSNRYGTIKTIKKIVARRYGFMVLNTDETTCCWGDGQISNSEYNNMSSGVYDIFGTWNDFVVQMKNRNVRMQGNYNKTMNNKDYKKVWVGTKWMIIADETTAELQGYSNSALNGCNMNNIKAFYTNDQCAAILKTDGTVLLYGSYNSYDTSDNNGKILENVEYIVCIHRSMAAYKTDGTVVTWGDYDNYVKQGYNNLFLTLLPY